ncbi:MAG: rhomboid family intramembrane serine protease [Pseudomonadota bacterium]
MIPIRDENPTQGVPFLTIALIAANLLVYAYQLLLSGPAEQLFIYDYGLVPGWLTHSARQGPPPDFIARPLTVLTSMFLHGDILHVAGNMLYLWIFGNNIEDRLGPVRFLAFYLVGGVLAALAFVLTEPGAMLPMVGASGAIAAVLGAYFLLYPRANVVVLIWFFFFVNFVRVPAVLMLGIWFLFQVLGVGGSGVAWMAHIGGFVAGLLLIRLFLPRPERLV